MLTIAGSALLAKLVDSEVMEWDNIGYGVMVMLLVSAFAGAMGAISKIRHKRMLVSALSGVVYIAILLSITALFFGGRYQAVGVTSGLAMAGSLTAGLLGLGQGRGKRHRKIRMSAR